MLSTVELKEKERNSMFQITNCNKVFKFWSVNRMRLLTSNINHIHKSSHAARINIAKVIISQNNFLQKSRNSFVICFCFFNGDLKIFI